MTAPYSGGHAITSMTWEDPQTLRVRFSTSYGSAYHHQVYVNRTLAAVTDRTTDREVLVYTVPSDWPPEVQLLAVDPAQAGTDYGSSLPPRPYNQVKLQWTTSGWTDTELIQITASTEPGGAVDATNVLKRIQFDANRTYEFVTLPLPGTGEWSFKVQGIDGTEPDGNRGTALDLAASIYAHPPDFTPQEDGTRFELVVASADLTVNCTEAI